MSIDVLPAPIVDHAALRNVMARYPTGLCAITAMADDGAPVGMTVGTFTSVSLDPPLVGFLPARASSSFARLRTAETFVANILSAEQDELAGRFASSVDDKFAGVPWHAAPLGAPIIDGSVAWIEARFEQVVEAGDHYFVTGLVQAMGQREQARPVIYCERQFTTVAPLR